jgi:UTP--glucose-1-phosphate uridylyltransferase
MILDEVDPAARELLERFGFDDARFEAIRARVASGELTAASNVVRGVVEPPPEDELTPLPAPGAPGYEEAREAGLAALRDGRVAAVVLAGGMATRFGGLVKGLVEAIGGRSFLEVKLGETARLEAALGVEVPTALMTSFATDEATRAALGRWPALPQPQVFSQFVAPRLRPDGALFRDGSGAVSLYGPGHGDLLEAVRASGTLASLAERGVQHVTVSNVDNLGARVDPVVIGAHVLSGRPLTVEVARKDGDMGGAPARVDGRMMLLEGFRFPPGFDHDTIPVFNTNTAVVDVEVLEQSFELTWLYVEKGVDGERVVQLERLYHEIAAFVPTTFLVVPRHGPRGRFFPIKVPADLERSHGALEEMLAGSPAE